MFFDATIQQLGALPLDVERCHVDFLAADAHKWLLAPEGIAVFYCRDSARPQLNLLQQGWHMADRPWDFNREEWLPSDTALRFEAGSPNSLGQAALHASAGLLLDTGMDRVGSRVLANTDFLISALLEIRGIQVSSDTALHRRSGIVSFRHAEIAADELYRNLQKQGVFCAVRGQSVRWSPHFYQGEQELVRAVDALAHMV